MADGKKIIPLELNVANNFVEMYHRHNRRVAGHKFSLGLEEDGELIGVLIAGRPIARMLDNKRTIEILRVCVKEGHKNANSKLYGRAKQIAQLMGFEKIITYTLQNEKQSSLKAIGAKITGETKPQLWNREKRHRENQAVYLMPKFRWEL